MHSLGLEIAPNRVSDFCLAYYVCRIGGSFLWGVLTLCSVYWTAGRTKGIKEFRTTVTNKQ